MIQSSDILEYETAWFDGDRYIQLQTQAILERIEKFSGKLNHGEAVLLGMMTACIFSYKKKLLPKNDLELINQHYINANLPRKLKNQFKITQINNIVNFMKRDKKNLNDKINLVLIKKIGTAAKLNSTATTSKELKKFLIDLY